MLGRTTGHGTAFEGTEGWVQFGFDGLKTHPESLMDSKIGPNEIRLPSDSGFWLPH